jgi:hypothetical protein
MARISGYQKPTVLTATRSTNYFQSSPSASTWYIPDTALNIQLGPGKWRLSLQGSILIGSATAVLANQFVSSIAFGSSTTPGSGLVEAFASHHFCYAGSNVSFNAVNHITKPFEVSSLTTYYINLKFEWFSGSPAVDTLGLRTDDLSDIVLIAERLD